MHKANGFDYDYVVIGSGFGGSVSTPQLSERGYGVAVLEKGKRWQKEDFPKTNHKNDVGIVPRVVRFPGEVVKLLGPLGVAASTSIVLVRDRRETISSSTTNPAGGSWAATA